MVKNDGRLRKIPGEFRGLVEMPEWYLEVEREFVVCQVGESMSSEQATIKRVATITVITLGYMVGIRGLINSPSVRRKVKRGMTLP